MSLLCRVRRPMRTAFCTCQMPWMQLVPRHKTVNRHPRFRPSAAAEDSGFHGDAAVNNKQHVAGCLAAAGHVGKQAAKSLGTSLQTLLNHGSPRTNLAMQKALMAVHKCLSESKNSTVHFERVQCLFHLLGQTAAETGPIVEGRRRNLKKWQGQSRRGQC